MDNEKLVKTIRDICKQNSISVSQLEKELNFGAGLISRWIKTDPSLSKIVDIADYFNIHIDDLIGRTLKSDNTTSEQFMDSLLNMTTNKTLKWLDRTNLIQDLENDEDFGLDDGGFDISELFMASYEKGSFWIYAQYDEEKGNILDTSIELYIRPDNNSQIILQNVDEDKLTNLWLYIHTLLFGSPDEVKAEEFKNAFVLNKSLLNGNDVLSGGLNDCSDTEVLSKVANDPAVQQLIKLYNQPEFQKMQQVVTSPEFQAAIETANKIQKNFNIK